MFCVEFLGEVGFAKMCVEYVAKVEFAKAVEDWWATDVDGFSAPDREEVIDVAVIVMTLVEVSVAILVD